MVAMEDKFPGSRRISSDRERQAPILLEVGEDVEGKVEPSHFARYNFALDLVKGTDYVLDVPCGTGYGSALLGQRARQVLGVDISAPAIGHAEQFFARENVAFTQGNVEDLPGEVKNKGPFGVVVSFEGIEHVADPVKMLQSIKSALAHNGRLVISTPRKPHGSPHHIVEFSLEEFKAIVEQSGLLIEDLYGQIYTSIFNLNDRPDVNPLDYERFNFIAVCRNPQ